MEKYRTEYSNHVHLLLVSVSKHLYILNNRTLKYQKKKMDYNLKNLNKSDKELVVHYLIADHFSGVLYGEIHSSKKLIPVEEFLFRAWSKKDKFTFCGIPSCLSVPQTIESEELRNLLSSLKIELINPTGGFMGGVKHLSIWEDCVRYHEYFYYFENKRAMTFEELQAQNLKICINESQNELRRGGGKLSKKIELWERFLKDHRFIPAKKDFFELAKKKTVEKAPKLSPVIFEVYEGEEGEEYGDFIWGDEREEVFECYYDINEEIASGNLRTMASKISKLIEMDPEFIGAYELMGHLEFSKLKYKEAVKAFGKGVEIGDRLMPQKFKGEIVYDNYDNRCYLGTLYHFGLSLLKVGRYIEAIDALERLLSYCSNYRNEINYYIGISCMHLNQISKAIGLFSETFEEPRTRYCLGILEFKNKQLEEAVKHLRYAFMTNPFIAMILTEEIRQETPFHFNMFRTLYSDALEFVEDIRNVWDSDQNFQLFFSVLYQNDQVQKEIQKFINKKKLLINRYNFTDKLDTEELKTFVRRHIETIPSQEICADILKRISV